MCRARAQVTQSSSSLPLMARARDAERMDSPQPLRPRARDSQHWSVKQKQSEAALRAASAPALVACNRRRDRRTT